MAISDKRRSSCQTQAPKRLSCQMPRCCPWPLAANGRQRTSDDRPRIAADAASPPLGSSCETTAVDSKQTATDTAFFNQVPYDRRHERTSARRAPVVPGAEVNAIAWRTGKGCSRWAVPTCWFYRRTSSEVRRCSAQSMCATDPNRALQPASRHSMTPPTTAPARPGLAGWVACGGRRVPQAPGPARFHF